VHAVASNTLKHVNMNNLVFISDYFFTQSAE
jgi:hypothetical protein